MKQKKNGLFTWVILLALVCTLGFVGCPNPADSDDDDDTPDTPIVPDVPEEPSWGIYGVWYETAYAQWEADPADTSFNVQIRLNGGGWEDVDGELVRKIDATNNIWRVDVPGLRNTAGTSYDLRILDADDDELHIATGLAPRPFDRQGYAFTLNAATGVFTTTGGYNPDGTVPYNAEIVYITNDNMDDLTSGRFNSKTTAPVIIRFIGQVGTQNGRDTAAEIQSADIPVGCSPFPTIPPDSLGSGGAMYSISNSKNITIEGIGPDAYIEGWGFSFSGCTNVVVRNLKFDWWYDDAVYLNNTTSGWVDHNSFGYGVDRTTAGIGGNDHQKGDGATDIGGTSTLFTVSYNRYDGSGKSMLIGGSSSNAIGHGTVHHNWFKNTDERTPRLRNGWVHVFNNIYDDVGPEPGEGKGYGIGAGHRSNIVSEGNTFIHTYRPYIISGELSSNAAGPNVDGNINTLSGDAPGVIITSLYAGSPSAFDLTGRNLVPDTLDDWSKNTDWYFEDELTLVGGPTFTNNLRGTTPGAYLTYAFVPFHTATGWRTDGTTAGPSGSFSARAPISATLAGGMGVESAANGAATVRQWAGIMRMPE